VNCLPTDQIFPKGGSSSLREDDVGCSLQVTSTFTQFLFVVPRPCGFAQAYPVFCRKPTATTAFRPDPTRAPNLSTLCFTQVGRCCVISAQIGQKRKTVNIGNRSARAGQHPFLEENSRVTSHDRARSGVRWPLQPRVISADIGQKRRASVVYTFTSPFSFSSAAENGPFFFWFRWVLPSCGGVV
jgi:hypothetical protein